MSIFCRLFIVQTIISVVVFIFAVFCPNIALASIQSDEGDAFIISHYSTTQGFPSKTVTDITIGKDGYLYAASVGGLIRMDGHHVDVFTTENVPGMISNRIAKVFSISPRSLAIQDHQGNMYRFQNGRASALVNPESGLVISTSIVRELKNESLLLVDQYHAYTVTDTSVTIKFNSLSSFPIWDVASYEDDLYLLNTDGLYVSGENGYIKINMPEAYKPDLSFFTRIELIDTHYRIIGRQKSTCYDVKQQSWCPTHSVVLNNDQEDIFNIKKYQNGYLIATSQGFYYQSSDTLNRIFQSSEALRYESIFETEYGQILVGQDGVWVNDSLIFKPLIRINDAIKDNDDGLWISSSQDGLYHIRKNKFSTFLVPQVVNSYSIIKDRSGRFWASSFENGIIRWNHNHTKIFNHENGYLPSNTVRMMSSLNDGGILVSVWGEPPLIIRGDSIESLVNLRPLFGNRSNVTESFYEDKTGTLWFGTLQGLFIKEGSRYRTYFDRNGRTISKISKIVKSPFNDDLFFCTTDKGVVVLKNNEFHYLSEILPAVAKHIRDLHIPSADTIWALSYNTGIQRYTKPSGSSEYKIVQFDSNYGFQNAGYHRILADTLGSFWISTNEGLLNVSESGLNRSIEMGSLSTTLRWFTQENGIIDSEFNGGTQNTGFYDLDNHRMWFTNSRGIVSFNPYSFFTTTINEETFRIQSISTSDTLILYVVDSQSIYNINTRSIIIKFAHVALSENQTSNIWVYRSDTDKWTLPTNPGYLVLNNLRHGKTTLKFGTSAGSNIIKQVEVNVIPKFYERKVVQIMTGILFVGIAFLIYRVISQSSIVVNAKEYQDIKTISSLDDSTIEKTDRIEMFIKEHFSESDLDITKIAKGLGVSRSTLFRMWNESHTLSITDYINQLRLDEAAKLLSSGEYNVTEVAFMSGFSSQSYFTKKFKSMFGYPPSKTTS